MICGRAHNLVPFALLAVLSVLILIHTGFDHASFRVSERIPQWWDKHVPSEHVLTHGDKMSSSFDSASDVVVANDDAQIPTHPDEVPVAKLADSTSIHSSNVPIATQPAASGQSEDESTNRVDPIPYLESSQNDNISHDLVIAFEAPSEHTVHEYDPDADLFSLPDHYTWDDPDNAHHTLKSISSIDERYYLINYGNHNVSNPNVVPHDTLPDTYIVVSQLNDESREGEDLRQLKESACNAKYVDNELVCFDKPYVLPIANTTGNWSQCPPGNEWIQLMVGPHDARIFWGPKTPYIIYGSSSSYSCMGLWIQDLRMLVDDNVKPHPHELFATATELQKPTQYMFMEKNYFVFWDDRDQMYVHHEVFPNRIFAKLEIDGSVGPNLGPTANDDACLASHVGGKPLSNLESIHQSTNSLAITLCKRGDPACIPNNDNTVIFTIYQQKSFYQWHANYEPFVMAFHQTAPFSIYGFSQRPLYIHGRTKPGDSDRPSWFEERFYDQTEMFYVTSMSWKTVGQKYHGYLDDTLLINFGIEDQRAATIDVNVSDLFFDMKRCSDPL